MNQKLTEEFIRTLLLSFRNRALCRELLFSQRRNVLKLAGLPASLLLWFFFHLQVRVRSANIRTSWQPCWRAPLANMLARLAKAQLRLSSVCMTINFFSFTDIQPPLVRLILLSRLSEARLKQWVTQPCLTFLTPADSCKVCNAEQHNEQQRDLPHCPPECAGGSPVASRRVSLSS